MSLSEISQDHVESNRCSNQPIFRTDIHYDRLLRTRDEIVQKWKSLPQEDRKNFKDQIAFEKANDCPDLTDKLYTPAKNLSLLKKEVRARLGARSGLDALAIDSLGFRESLVELLGSGLID